MLTSQVHSEGGTELCVAVMTAMRKEQEVNTEVGPESTGGWRQGHIRKGLCGTLSGLRSSDKVLELAQAYSEMIQGETESEKDGGVWTCGVEENGLLSKDDTLA